MWLFQSLPTSESAQDDGSLAPQNNVIPEEAKEPASYYPAITGYVDSRLSIPFSLRFPMSMAFGAICGFLIQAPKGGARAAFQYRAENAHRFPTTKNGWYFYHKTKNYKSIIGGVVEGVRFGTQLSLWAALFVGSEEAIDKLRGRGSDKQRDAAGTVCAGMTTAGFYSWVNGYEFFTAARIARIALKVSLAYGLLQDVLSTARGKQPAYIDWLGRNVLGQRDKIEA